MIRIRGERPPAVIDSISSLTHPTYTARTSAKQGAAAASDRVAMKGSACPGLEKCQRTGSLSGSEPFQVSVILQRPRPMNFQAGPFQTMSRDELSKFSASKAEIGKVQKFAKQNGLVVSGVNAETRTVTLQGTAATYEKAFGVQLGQYRDAQGREFRGYQGAVQLPKSLAGSVVGVFGLDNRPIARSHVVIGGPIGAKADGSFTPPELAAAYNFPKGTDGTGQTIGIIELGGGYREEDLKAYFAKLGIPEPNVKSVSVDGGTNTPTGDPNSADAEVALDIEVAGAVAPGANIVVYNAPNSEEGFIHAIAQAAHDQENHPNTLSISWGAPEKAWTPQGLQGFNDALNDAASLGINTFVASGDNGSSDGENDKKNHVDYPSAAPYAIGTGGTSLTTKDGKIDSETVWNNGFWGGATGGGVSDNFGLPDYQQNANVPKSTSATGGRGVPDVAADADPGTGYVILVDGQEMTIGGTSAAAPLWAGLTARLGQGVGQNLGFLNPVFYANATGDFNDITSGNNGAFSAGPGWDANTGLGTPDGEKLLAKLNSLKPQPTPPPAPQPTPAPAPEPPPSGGQGA